MPTPLSIRETRPSGRRPLSAAVDFGHDDVALLLLERGADPNWGEPAAPKGRSLHSAASAGNLRMVELLLAHGADPNAHVDSSADAISLAKTPEIRGDSRGNTAGRDACRITTMIWYAASSMIPLTVESRCRTRIHLWRR